MAENTPMLDQEVKPYGPGNPHPNYGKDPNIMNECGHTHYPKWVDGVLVKSAKEEKDMRATGPKVEEKKPDGWDKK